MCLCIMRVEDLANHGKQFELSKVGVTILHMAHRHRSTLNSGGGGGGIHPHILFINNGFLMNCLHYGNTYVYRYH